MLRLSYIRILITNTNTARNIYISIFLTLLEISCKNAELELTMDLLFYVIESCPQVFSDSDNRNVESFMKSHGFLYKIYYWYILSSAYLLM